MVLGITACMAIYVAINAAYLYALPIQQVATTVTIGQDAAAALFSPRAAFWISGLIFVSCFGAAVANLGAGARVFFAMAENGLFFRRMARVHPRYRTPAFSLVVQAIVISLSALTGTFNQLLTYATLGMLLFYVIGTLALFVLRRTMPEAPRPYRCTGYPVVPALYILLTGAWAVNTVVTMPKESLYGIALILSGLPLYFFWKRRTPAAA
jgi:basic amino acid/polyamine antiporter, APA family